MYKIAARYTTGSATGYTDDTVRARRPRRGPLPALGQVARVRQLAREHGPGGAPHRPLGRARPRSSMGETIDFPVNVHNWSDVAAERHGQPDAAGELHARPQTSKPYGPLAPGRATRRSRSQVDQQPTRRMPADRSRRTSSSRRRTRRAGRAPRPSACRSCPKTTIAQAPATPALDGVDSAGRVRRLAARHRPHLGGRRQLHRGRLRHRLRHRPGARRRPDDARTPARRGATTRCTSSSASATSSRATRSRPAECVGHWLADSVEILIDPRGRASDNAMDTANTFKLGIFPFTNDPTNSNGNGANGPCWSRDADNHQGFSTGPLAATVDGAPNAPGVQVVLERARGSAPTRRRTDHAYARRAATRSRSRSRRRSCRRRSTRTAWA